MIDQEMHTLKKFLEAGESLTVEFKKCRGGLNRDVYETVCAFLNRHGGTLLLGVNDKREVAGIPEVAVEQIKKDFVTAVNNPKKISPPVYLQVESISIDGKTILRIYVPEGSQVYRCNGRIYDLLLNESAHLQNLVPQVLHLFVELL